MSSNGTIRQHLPEWPEWMDLKILERYSSVSNRTLRSWIKAPEDPLPASARGGKILVSRRLFDEWMKGHAIEATSVDVERAVNSILKSL
jgi:hypothetical protein